MLPLLGLCTPRHRHIKRIMIPALAAGTLPINSYFSSLIVPASITSHFDADSSCEQTHHCPANSVHPAQTPHLFHKGCGIWIFPSKMRSVSIFLSFFWSKSDLNYTLLKAGAHFTRTPLCQAMVRSQIRLAGGKEGLNVFLGSPEEDPSAIWVFQQLSTA